MRSMQRWLKPAGLLAAACRSETLHEALCIAQRSTRLSSALDECSSIRQIPLGLESSTIFARRELASNATTPQHQLFDESMDVSSPCKVTAVLHTPTHVHVAKGVMERLKVQVLCADPHESTSESYVLHRGTAGSIEFTEIPEISNITETVGVGSITHELEMEVPERFCSADISSEGGDVEVSIIKEGALTVYSGQRMFPLTFQMPESGLALKERRWHASRKGGDVSLGSISASELEVYTCGGSLHGQSLVAGDVDIETGGGAVEVRKLMGTHVHLSTEDDEPASKACGAVSIGAVYADSLHLVTGGKDALIQELNTKAAYVAAPGGAGITVESLAGTCVLSAGAASPDRAAVMARSRGIEAHLSGRIGHVMLVSHGGPVKVYLPHSAAQALTVLMRPLGAPALEELLSSSSQEGLMARLGQWQRLSSFGNDSLPIWTTLDTQGIASLIEPLQSFKGLGCCKHLIDDEGGDHSLDSGVEEHETLQRDHGLVLLDAAGGEVSVLQQSWTEMMAAKIGGPGVAIRPSKDL